MKITKIIGALAIMAMASSAHAVSFVIDHFDANGSDSIIEGAAASTTTTNDVGILGGSRDVTLSAPDNGDLITGGALGYTINTGADYLAVANAPGVKGTVTVTWDDFTGVDFTAGGVNNFLRVNVLSIDLSTSVSFTLTDSSLNSATVGPQAFGASGVFLVGLDAFTGVDETSVDSLVMVLTGNTAWDGVFDLVETGTNIPVPAPLALLGFGLVGVALSRRKTA